MGADGVASSTIWEGVKIEGPDAAGVATLSLNRPSRANALNEGVFRELPLALRQLDDDPSVRVVILSAAGKRHFCSGIDLDTLSGTTREGQRDKDTGRREPGKERETMRRFLLVMQDAITAIEKCSKPVIAAIFGVCYGGGIDLVTACDLRYSTEDAKFSVLEVDLAIVADLGTLQRLPAIVGYAKAMELALTARMFDGNEASRIGLVSAVFSSKEDLEKGVREIATKMAEKSPMAITGTKAVLLKSRDLSIGDGLDWVAAWNSGHLWSHEVKEALEARMEKRKPIFAKL